MIPVQGEVFASDWKSYQYLGKCSTASQMRTAIKLFLVLFRVTVESIRRFPDQDDFAAMITEAGFKLVNYENLTNGVAAIHTAFKSDDEAN